jgi:hypothetical protein
MLPKGCSNRQVSDAAFVGTPPGLLPFEFRFASNRDPLFRSKKSGTSLRSGNAAPSDRAAPRGFKLGILKAMRARVFGDDDYHRSQSPCWVLSGRSDSSSVKLRPEEGVRLMRAFVRIEQQELREIVILLATSLADAAAGKD